MKRRISFLILIAGLPLGTLLFAGHSSVTALSWRSTSSVTPTFQGSLVPTKATVVTRAPCDGEATRTPTPNPTPTATREPTPTASATTWGPDLLLQLYWPPNCAVLHSPTLPVFEFDRIGAPFTATLEISSPDNNFHLTLYYADFLSREHNATSIALPDGTYYWSVYASRASGYSRHSEIWEFQIDTSCHCTDTPTPVLTLTP
jgi:hypothetical protein